MLYDDLVAEFHWSPEQMSAPFDLRAADEKVRKRIESRRRSAQGGDQQRPRSRQKTVKPDVAGSASGGYLDNRV
ncbi:hypothetical protein [Nocardioides panzhihuensis]|uniref:Uncharacterized protein n=1 Tax=Nocardioides panzhihuensis TaxID=860243 RepID=A0A7Z0DLP5_9ACTN|nr:hypothetical protein [Nocardioides panzhihuensis]NYI77532.1 hypothetical protein [Nocardioides panzhihuensis]